MSTQNTSASSPWLVHSSWILTGLTALAMLGSVAMKLGHSPETVSMFSGKLGYSESILPTLALLELGATLLYLFPRTSVLGAIVLTGYLGGAIATHVRIGDPFLAPLILGVLAWVALFLRSPRLRAILPAVT